MGSQSHDEGSHDVGSHAAGSQSHDATQPDAATSEPNTSTNSTPTTDSQSHDTPYQPSTSTTPSSATASTTPKLIYVGSKYDEALLKQHAVPHTIDSSGLMDIINNYSDVEPSIANNVSHTQESPNSDIPQGVNVSTQHKPQESPNSVNSGTQQGVNDSTQHKPSNASTHASNTSDQTHSQSTKPPRNTIWFKGTWWRSSYRFLSNLYERKVTVYGRTFDSQERAYQWKKAIEEGSPEEADAILNAPTPLDAMYLGQDIKTSARWKEKTKFEVMTTVKEAAFCQNKDIRDKLLGTGDRPIREATEHTTWGGKPGCRNKMGELYEQLRDCFRAGILKPDPVHDTSKHLDPNAAPFQPNNQGATKVSSRKPSKQSNSSSPHPQHRSKSPLAKPVMKGVVLGDSTSQSVHPRLPKEENWVFSTVPVPGGRVCAAPGSKYNLHDKLCSVINGDEDVIILGGGPNDVKHNTPWDFKEHYRCMVKTAKQRSPNARIILLGMYHRGDARGWHAIQSLNIKVDQFNSAIRAISIEENCEFIDNCYAVGSSVENPNFNVLTTPKKGIQYLHLKADEQRSLSARISRQIQGVFESRRLAEQDAAVYQDPYMGGQPNSQEHSSWYEQQQTSQWNLPNISNPQANQWKIPHTTQPQSTLWNNPLINQPQRSQWKASNSYHPKWNSPSNWIPNAWNNSNWSNNLSQSAHRMNLPGVPAATDYSNKTSDYDERYTPTPTLFHYPSWDYPHLRW